MYSGREFRAPQTTPILCINLERSGDRWRTVEAQAHRLDLLITRFAGIDASAFPSKEAVAGQHGFEILPYRRPFRTGEVGCWASHLEALRFVARIGKPAIILEDDAILSEDFPDIMALLEDMAFDGVVKMQGGNLKQRGLHLMPFGRRSLVLNPWPKGGAACYYLSPSAAERIADRMTRMDRNVDRVLFDETETGVPLLEVWPYPARQDKRFVSLLHTGKKRRKTLRQRWKRLAGSYALRLSRGARGTAILLRRAGPRAFLKLTPLMSGP